MKNSLYRFPAIFHPAHRVSFRGLIPDRDYTESGQARRKSNLLIKESWLFMIDQRLTLVLMAGLRATGKTTLAKELSYALGWPVINRDMIKACLLTASGIMTEDTVGEIAQKLSLSVPQPQWPMLRHDWFRDRLTYYLETGEEMTDDKAGEVSYNLSFDLIKYSLKSQNVSVILDTGTHHPFILQNAERIAYDADAAIKTIHCMVSNDIRCQRLAKREPYPAFMKGRETPSDEASHNSFHQSLHPKLSLDTSTSLENNLIEATKYVLESSLYVVELVAAGC